ncbi:phosphatase PAP2 family protein [Aliiroseovarius sp. 2305UL8-7]|uniref:phosphatase PAP2 family protein n=1 Tax=Aliiroseovarius conchicola TaxID=3121637 RepID=UPI00352973A0
MRLFLTTTFAYLIIGGLIILVFRDNPISLIGEMIATIPHGLKGFLVLGWWLVPVFLIFAFFKRRQLFLRRISHAVLGAFACSAFFVFFTMIKTTLPMIVPFWADPMIADVDHLMHFGIDPWRITHALTPHIPVNLLGQVYFSWWLLPAMYLPVLIIMFDSDCTRFRRFTILYFVAWIGLGNVWALAFMSAGPVYYDRLYDTNLFAPMIQTLDGAGITTGAIGNLMNHLWDAYESGAQKIGSGISAFPSVHVGMATVFALYMYERHRLLLIPSIIVVAIFQFLSVYQGWHYAIDGYFSILLIWLYWIYLRRRAVRSLASKNTEAIVTQ